MAGDPTEKTAPHARAWDSSGPPPPLHSDSANGSLSPQGTQGAQAAGSWPHPTLAQQSQIMDNSQQRRYMSASLSTNLLKSSKPQFFQSTLYLGESLSIAHVDPGCRAGTPQVSPPPFLGGSSVLLPPPPILSHILYLGTGRCMVWAGPRRCTVWAGPWVRFCEL